MFRQIGLFWIIQSNKNLNFDFKNHFPSWILNDPWYTTTMCSQLYGSVFGDYFATAKRDKYNLMCSIEAHRKIRNQSTITNLLMIVGRYPTNKLGTRIVVNRAVLHGTNRRRIGIRTQ